jgi:PAS domain S-box-containing protein
LKTDGHLGEENLQELYDIAPCGYLSTLADGTIVGVNQTFLAWTGYSKEDLLSSKRFQELLTNPGRIFYETHYAPLLQMQGSVKEITFDLLCKDRDPLPVLVNSRQQNGRAGQPTLIHSAFFDATDRRKYERELLHGRRQLEEKVTQRTTALEREVQERKRAEEDLRELTAKLLKLRDDERRSLARELHDSVGQLLVAMTFNVATIQAESDKLSPKAVAAISQNAGLINEMSSEVRTISHLLHPPLLDEVGLTSALTWYVDGLAQRAGMKISLELSPHLGRLSPNKELAIFRIVQECLTNVHRHSGSKTAGVRIVCSEESARVEVQDQGTGIPAAKLEKIRSHGSGVGLRGMRERVTQLGGILEITSNAGGTLVVTTLPNVEPSE